MSVRRKTRFTEKETGTLVRVYDIQVTNMTEGVEVENSALVLYSDKENQLHFAMEAKEFNEKFVAGWLSKVELGLEEPTVEEEPETIGEKVKDAIDAVGDKLDDLAEDAKEIVDEIKEGAENIAEEIEETVEDIQEAIED